MPRIIKICIGALGAAIVLISSLLFTFAIQVPEQAIPIADIAAADIEENKYYLATLCIIDCYAFSGTEGKDNCVYDYYVMFEDGEQKLYSASLSVPVTSPVSKALQNYYENEEMMIGDCVIDCYVKADRIGFTDRDSIEFFGEIADYYKDIISVEDELEISFEYFCGANESFSSLRKEIASEKAVLFTVLTVIGAIMIITAFAVPTLSIKKSSPDLSSAENEIYQNAYIGATDNGTAEKTAATDSKEESEIQQ